MKLFKNFRVRAEPIRTLVPEIRPLHALHYGETEIKYLAHPMEPDYQGFADLESTGQFIVYAARESDTGRLVGYLMYFLARSLHMAANVATEDAFYVLKEHRGSGLARFLLRYAEEDLAQNGVDYVFMSSKHHVGGPNLGPFFDTNEYSPVAVVFAKRLEK